MNYRIIILSLAGLLATFSLCAQVVFKTLVTNEPVVLGQSCRVQYVMEEVTPDDEFFAPEFKFFKINFGPDVSAATDGGTGGFRKLRNISFVITPQKKGILVIPPGKAIINGKTYFSDQAFIKVITPEEADARLKKQNQQGKFNPNIYLAPGEDPAEKIRQGLFMKVSVDRKSCFVGQPVTATFKLYSRLYSKSDIVKNPGFYGFTVQDVVGLKDKKMESEEVDGRLYDVHTVRTVQLYPLNEGEFEIDPMEVSSQVNFSTSAIDKMPEQAVTEGVFEDDTAPLGPGWVRYEHRMKSEPVMIAVKSLPEKGKPASWTGAVGKFAVSWKIVEGSPAANEEAHLEVMVLGKGNFSQLVAPSIKWPAGIEGFEPKVVDEWDVNKKPLHGYRKFIYPFVASRRGSFTLPALSFAFFNTDSNKYNTFTAAALSFDISRDRSPDSASDTPAVKKGPKQTTNPAGLYIGIIVTLVLLGVIIMWRRETRREKAKPPPPPPPAEVKPIDDFLRPAAILMGADDQGFFAALNQGTWQYLSDRLHVSGTQMNKNTLRQLLTGRLPEPLLQDLLITLETCEMGIYTVVDAGYDKQRLMESAYRILGEIDRTM